MVMEVEEQRQMNARRQCYELALHLKLNLWVMNRLSRCLHPNAHLGSEHAAWAYSYPFEGYWFVWAGLSAVRMRQIAFVQVAAVAVED